MQVDFLGSFQDFFPRFFLDLTLMFAITLTLPFLAHAYLGSPPCFVLYKDGVCSKWLKAPSLVIVAVD